MTTRSSGVAALVVLYAAVAALIWYVILPQALLGGWAYVAVLIVAHVLVGVAVARPWALLLPLIAVAVALPDEPSADGVPAIVFAAYAVAAPGTVRIAVGLAIRAVARHGLRRR